jgi:3-oxoacyl-[acyl-carrier protein] reductase
MHNLRDSGSRLRDKVAIITGGGYGIGRAFSVGLAREGARIVVVFHTNMQRAEETVKEIEYQGGKAVAVKADVSKPEDTINMAHKAAEQFGGIDILINNAAISSIAKLTYGPFEDLDLAEWDRVMEVNLKGPFLGIRAVFPYMKERGSGKIINIGSGAFFLGQGFTPHYVASKGGVIGLTRSLSTALGKYNINVNCLAAGKTISEGLDDKKALEECERRVPFKSIKRIGYPEDLVGAAIFFASSDSDFITGQTLYVEGGEVKH